jgi:hypothetical protein
MDQVKQMMWNNIRLWISKNNLEQYTDKWYKDSSTKRRQQLCVQCECVIYGCGWLELRIQQICLLVFTIIYLIQSIMKSFKNKILTILS